MQRSGASLLSTLRRFVPAPLRARARVAFFRLLGLSWTCPSGVMLRVESYDEWIVHQEIFVDGEYDRAIELAIAGAPSDRALRVLDLGAHVGLFTLRFVDRLRTVRGRDASFRLTAIEARPEAAVEFRRRVLGDNGLQDSVTLVEGLVGPRQGRGRIHHGEHAGQSSLLAHRERGSAEAPFVDLGTLVRDTPTIDLIKCDIEGAELMVVEHQPEVFHKARVVVFEMHDALCDTARCRQRLGELGFVEQAGGRTRDGLSIYLGVKWARSLGT